MGILAQLLKRDEVRMAGLEIVSSRHERVSEILTKKRTLSFKMIRRLHPRLHIPMKSLIGTMT